MDGEGRSGYEMRNGARKREKGLGEVEGARKVRRG